MNAPQNRTKLRATMARRTNPRDLGSDSLNYDAQPEPNMRLSRAIAIVLLLHIVAVGGVLAFSLIKDRVPQPLTRAKPAAATPTPASASAPAPALSAGAATAAPKRNEPAAGTAEKKLAATPAGTTPNAAAKPKTTTHVVRAGETLARVASENSVSLGSLIAVNDARITTANLKPGQEIQIPVAGAPKERVQDEATRLIEASGPPVPPKPATTPVPAKSAPAPNVAKALPVTPAPAPAAATPANAKPAAKPANSTEKTYVVVAGDNPNKLAKKFGISENALLKANGIEDPRKLRIGQQLVIPARTAK